MYSWYQRKKQQAWALALASGAGLTLAYFAYNWYMSTDENGEELKRELETPHSKLVTQNSRTSPAHGQSRGASSGSASQLEELLREQQVTLQAIANKQRLPEMQQRLHKSLLLLSGVDRLTADLRALRPSAPPAATGAPSAFPPTSSEHAERMTRKLELWCELRDQSFVLLTATTWLLPALTLLVHVQLTIIGRSSYLEHLVRNAEAAASNSFLQAKTSQSRKSSPNILCGASMDALSPAQQEAFLSYGSFLLETGMERILPLIQDIVRRHVHSLALQQPVSLSKLWDILSRIHEDVDSSILSDAWRSVLLPPLVNPSSSHQPAEPEVLGNWAEEFMESKATPCHAHDNAAPGRAHSPGASPASKLGPQHDASSTAIPAHPELTRTPGSLRHSRGDICPPHAAAPHSSYALPQQYRPQGLDDSSAAVVAKLVLEAQQVLQSKFFSVAFQASVKWCAAAVADALQHQFPVSSPEKPGQQGSGVSGELPPHTEPAIPTAAILPRVAKVADELLNSGAGLSEDLCRLPAVRALLDAAFASGPFLDVKRSSSV